MCLGQRCEIEFHDYFETKDRLSMPSITIFLFIITTNISITPLVLGRIIGH